MERPCSAIQHARNASAPIVGGLCSIVEAESSQLAAGGRQPSRTYLITPRTVPVHVLMHVLRALEHRLVNAAAVSASSIVSVSNM
jgi:hypothetical protein